jgi:hypothetical protein
VSEAALSALRQRDVAAIAYADLPYAIADPDLLIARIHELQSRGIGVEDYPVQEGDSEAKAVAIQCYRSQVALVDVSMCCDREVERFFRISF